MEPSARFSSPPRPVTASAENTDGVVKPGAGGKPPARSESHESSADQAEMPLPSDLRTVFQGGLFFLALLAALYAAR